MPDKLQNGALSSLACVAMPMSPEHCKTFQLFVNSAVTQHTYQACTSTSGVLVGLPRIDGQYRGRLHQSQLFLRHK
jgi:hypothetical protein